MAIGLAQGIGQALVAGANQYAQSKLEKEARDQQDADRLRAQGIQDVRLGRETQAWDQAQQDRQAENLALAGQADMLANDENPVYQTYMHYQQVQNPPPAAVTTPDPTAKPAGGIGPTMPTDIATSRGMVQPQVAAPVNGLPTVVAGAPQGLAKIPASTPAPSAQANAPTAPQGPPRVAPAGWKSGDSEVDALNDKYQKVHDQTRQDLAKIREKAGGDVDKYNAMTAAYMRMKKPEIDKVDGELSDYNKKMQQKVLADEAYSKMKALYFGSDADMAKSFGAGTRRSIDPLTHVQGITLANGTFLPLQTATVMGLMGMGLADHKDLSKALETDGSNFTKAMEKKEQIASNEKIAGMQSAAAMYRTDHPSGDKITQRAEAAEANHLAMYPGDFKGAREAKQKVILGEKSDSDAKVFEGASKAAARAIAPWFNSQTKQWEDSFTPQMALGMYQSMARRKDIGIQTANNIKLSLPPGHQKFINDAIAEAAKVQAAKPAPAPAAPTPSAPEPVAKPTAKQGTPTAPPVSLLTEGQDTPFKNGQVWSLRNGKPVRVK
jgi:hypothetical protein